MRSSFKLGTFLSLCITAAMASCGSEEAAPATVCGNGIAEGDEGCDGADVRGQNCGMYSPGSTAVLTCTPACALDIARCGGAGGQGGAGPMP
jgi:hypothetical protein